MDLRFTPEETAFRDEVRGVLPHRAAGAHPRQARRWATTPRRRSSSNGRASSTPRAGRCRTGRSSGAAPAGTRCSSTSSRTRCSRRRRRRRLPFGVSMVGPVIIAFGIGGAEAPLPAAHRQSRRLVVPGLLRARLRLRPRLAQDHGEARRRRLRRQRPEDLDDARRSTPTGSSASSAPTWRRRSRRASPSSSST